MSHSVKFEKVHNIRVVLEEGEVNLPRKIRRVVEKHWESLIHSGKRYWNGPMFFLKRIDRCVRECPVLSVAETDYAHYLATAHGKIPEKYGCRSVYVSVFPKTADDFFVFGEMAEHTVSPGKVLCAGGGIERRYLFPDGSFDIRGNAGGEFKEELYLDIEDPDEVECFRPLFLKTGGDGNIGIFFEAKTRFSHEEILCQYIRGRNRDCSPELQSLVCVPATWGGVRDFLKKDRRQRVDYLEPLLEKVVSKRH